MYKPDYVVTWDFRDAEAPVVSFTKVYAEENTPHLMCDVLAHSYEHTGVVSFRQLIEEIEREKSKDGADT